MVHVPTEIWAQHHGFLLILWVGVRLGLIGTSVSIWPTVPASYDKWSWVWRSRRNENFQGKLKYSEKTSASATLSTKNPTRPDLESNPGRRGGMPATKSPELWHGPTARRLYRYINLLGPWKLWMLSSIRWINFVATINGNRTEFWCKGGMWCPTVGNLRILLTYRQQPSYSGQK
jgi:hypothetical protein